MDRDSPPVAPAIPDTLPVLPTREIVLFPLVVAPLVIGQERSVKLIDDVMNAGRLLVLAGYGGNENEQPGPDQLPKVATAAIIHQLLRAPDGTLRVLVQGLERVRIVEYSAEQPYLVARIEAAPDRTMPGVTEEALRRAVIELFRRLVALIEEIPKELGVAIEQFSDPRQVAYFVAWTMPLDVTVRQAILELDPLDAKLQRLIELLQHEVTVREIGQQITSQTRERLNDAQREYFLREQLRSIQKELGENEGGTEVADLRRRINEANLPAEAAREAERELSRLESMPPASPEHGIVMNFLDWMASLPWGRLTGATIDVPGARTILDQDHYDLEKVKQRILEYLAVRKLREEREAEARLLTNDESSETLAGQVTAQPAEELASREPILCLVGPPGVGKTSLGRSIARAAGRKFVRISLGGVHDEAEIRGHRRTYIGALPGRIIQGLRRAETRDPVFMLDEIDKVRSDWRGDPSSALLEVLDPAQNSTFVDNYLGVAFDLSKVLFIATANTLDSIPPPLLDRMEVLQLSGYTDQEKVAIGRQYLVPKQRTAHGLRDDELDFATDGLLTIVRNYTREAGVRNLDREIATITRKVAREIAEGRREPVVITAENVVAYLDRPRYHDETAERTDRPGVATGLAWTPVGGDVLFVEAALMPGHDERLILTGMLGDVMRESAQAALSFVRSNSSEFGIDPTRFSGQTIHIHVPAGAIPKDGPSAGVTMTTAIVSLMTGRVVRSNLAMTGEITLRGKVLPVGGIKEKVLAAHRAGVRTIILPRRNERDLDDIDPVLRSEITFVLADTAETVINAALEPENAALPSL